MQSRAWIAVLGLGVLAACGPAPSEKAEFPVVEAPERDLSIGPDGAAGISGSPEMTVAAITAAAPNYIVDEAQDQIDGGPFRIITLSAADEVVFRLLPRPDNHLNAVTTRSSQARGPRGEIVGVAKFAQAPATEVMFCASEMIADAPGFACATAPDGRFWRVYQLPSGYDGPTSPFEGVDPDFALDATLAEMRWMAPRGVTP